MESTGTIVDLLSSSATFPPRHLKHYEGTARNIEKSVIKWNTDTTILPYKHNAIDFSKSKHKKMQSFVKLNLKFYGFYLLEIVWFEKLSKLAMCTKHIGAFFLIFPNYLCGSCGRR